jgi:6-phosphogluconate dehydrogenase
MELGMIGLGRMGANLVRRLVRDGHRCVVYDVDAAVTKTLAEEDDGITGADTLARFVEQLATPRAVWIMVPAAFVGGLIDQLAPLLAPDDVVIDGGNSYYRDDLARAGALADRGLHYVDVGVSGGVFGLERGFCLMIGGEDEVVERLAPVFATIAPGMGQTLRTPGRGGDPSPAELGYLHCGPPGAGHFVKMVHNGIEYGMMAAYAEGLNILKGAGIGLLPQSHDAETTPLRNPEAYRYSFEIEEIAEVWRRGSVVASWLLDLTAAALVQDPELAEFSGHVSDSGEGRWTALAAIEEGVPAPVLTAALAQRFTSRGNAEYADKVLSAMRKQFGGHFERKAADEGKRPEDMPLTNVHTSGAEYGEGTEQPGTPRGDGAA